MTNTCICGSDLHLFLRGMPGMKAGDVLGHVRWGKGREGALLLTRQQEAGRHSHAAGLSRGTGSQAGQCHHDGASMTVLTWQALSSLRSPCVAAGVHGRGGRGGRRCAQREEVGGSGHFPLKTATAKAAVSRLAVAAFGAGPVQLERACTNRHACTGHMWLPLAAHMRTSKHSWLCCADLTGSAAE